MAVATEFMEDMLEKHGLLNRPRKTKTKNGETLARYRWRLLYNAIKESAGQTVIEERGDQLVSHGIKFLRKLIHQKPITEMYFIREKNLLLTIDGEMIRSFNADGSRRDVIAMQGVWSHLVYASHTDQFVGWTPDSCHLLLLTADTFEFITGSEAEDPVYQVLYNMETEEIITSHENYLQIWVFRYGNRHLLPRRKIAIREVKNEAERVDEVKPGSANSKNIILTLFARESTRSPEQRLFAVSGTRGVRCFHLHQGVCINYFRKLHRRQITAICFFNPLKILATGSADGSLKLWNTTTRQNDNGVEVQLKTLSLHMIFVGHSAAIQCIEVYPFECCLMTVSADHTLRVWSLEVADEVECRSLQTDVTQIIAHNDNEFFYSCSKEEINLWQAYILARQHTLLQGEVRQIVLVNHFNVQDDGNSEEEGDSSCVLLLMMNGLCHIVDTVSGSVICSAVARDPGKGELHHVISVDCSPLLQRLLVLRDDGCLMKFSLTSNPCQLLEMVTPEQDGSFVEANRLCIYEHRLSIKRPPTGQSFRPTSATYRDTREKLEAKTCVILFTGHSNGQLQCFDLDQTNDRDGDKRGCHYLVQAVDAHDRKPLLTLVAHPSHSQLLTSGEDNVIRVWRVFPYAREHLEPLMSFYCTHRPNAMAAFKQTMLACFDDYNSANYSTVVYQIDDRNRFDHPPDEDHMDTIKDVAACHNLKLFATTSLDGTVRIWNEKNRLIRVLQFHGLVDTLRFSSANGDLLLTINKTLYLVRHQHYLPKSYLRRLIMLGSRERRKMNKCQPLNETQLIKYSPSVIHILREIKSAFKYGQYNDAVPQEVLREVDKEKRAKQDAFARLAQREEEIRGIRDGEIKAKLTRHATLESKEDAFKKYLQMFYEPVDNSLPSDPYEEEKVIDAIEGKMRRHKEPRGFADVNPGFFPRLPTQKKVGSDIGNSLRGGYMPNSSLIALIWPPELIKEKSETRKPILTSNDISFLAAKARKKEAEEVQSETSEGTRFFNWDDDEEETTTLVIFDDEVRKSEEPPKLVEEASDFMSKMKDILERGPSLTEEEQTIEKEFSVQTARSETESVEMSARRTPTSSNLMKTLKREDIDTMKRIRSSTSSASSLRMKRQTTPLTETIEEVTLGQERSPSPSPSPLVETPVPPPKSPFPDETGENSVFLTEVVVKPPSPVIPDFLRSIMAEEWFNHLFAQTNIFEYFGQPMDASNVAYLLAVRMEDLTWKDKKSLLQAILTLHQREVLRLPIIIKIKNYQLQSLIQNKINISDRSQRYFLESLFKFWASMDMRYSDVLVELLMWYFEVDDSFQTTISDVLTYLGMNDPQSFVFKELDSWKLFEVREESRKEDLRHTLRDWFDKLLRQWRTSLRESTERGKSLKGLDGGSPKRPGAASHTGRSNISSRSHPSRDTAGTIERDVSQVSTNLSIDISSDDSSSDYWDALAYFIATENKKQDEMIRSKRAAAAARKAQFSNEDEAILDESQLKRNTVLVLPEIPPEKQFLVRLGESHADAIKLRKRYQPTLGLLMEKDYSQPAALQPLRGYQQALGGGFVPYLHLPMKPCFVTPFPNPLDDREWKETFEPDMLSLRLSNKYFLPAFSCPPKPF